MEMFDILAKDGSLTGETIARDKAHAVGAWHKAIVLWIVNRRNQILLQKRSAYKKTFAGCWDIVPSGHVEAGEYGAETAVRECFEEIGVEIDLKDIRYITTLLSNNKHDDIIDRHFNEYFMTFKDVAIDKMKKQDGEVDEIKWVDYAEYKRLVTARDGTKITSKWAMHDAFIDYFDKSFGV
jgi:isopentenyldiphosphate isomerase